MKTKTNKTNTQIAGCADCAFRMTSKSGGCYKFGYSTEEINEGKVMMLTQGGSFKISQAGRCLAKEHSDPKKEKKVARKIVLKEWFYPEPNRFQYVLEPLVTPEYVAKISRELKAGGIAHYEKEARDGELALVVSPAAIERGWFNQAKVS